MSYSKFTTERQKLSINEEKHNSPVSPSKYIQYIKKLNHARKENQDLKEGLKNLNKSLDRIIKKTKTPLRKRFASPIYESDEELNKKIESTEHLIGKYRSQINTLKSDKSSEAFHDKVKLSCEVNELKVQIQELEGENLKLKKKDKTVNIRENSDVNSVIKAYKQRCKQLEELVREDDRVINEFRKQIFVEKNSFKGLFGVNESEDFLTELKRKVNELETQKKQEENSWKQKIGELKAVIKEKSDEIIELETIFKAKDKNCRLKKVQIKSQQRENRLNLPPKSLVSSLDPE